MIRSTLRELRQGWGSAMLILWRQFSEPYRRTALGSFWALLLPIIPIAVYIMLRLALTNPNWDANGVHPAVYVSVGVSLWFLFRDLLMVPVSYVQRHRTLIIQTKFHSVLAALVGAGQAYLDLLLRLIFCLPVFYLFGDVELANGALALAYVFVASLLFLAVGTWLVPIWIVSPDLLEVVNIVLRFLIFFSLAIFPIVLPGQWNLLISANPFAFFIEGIRDLAFGEVYSFDLQLLGICAAAAVVLGLLGLYVIGSVNDRVKEVLSQ